jgi:hypothetical protein
MTTTISVAGLRRLNAAGAPVADLLPTGYRIIGGPGQHYLHRSQRHHFPRYHTRSPDQPISPGACCFTGTDYRDTHNTLAVLAVVDSLLTASSGIEVALTDAARLLHRSRWHQLFAGHLESAADPLEQARTVLLAAPDILDTTQVWSDGLSSPTRTPWLPLRTWALDRIAEGHTRLAQLLDLYRPTSPLPTLLTAAGLTADPDRREYLAVFDDLRDVAIRAPRWLTEVLLLSPLTFTVPGQVPVHVFTVPAGIADAARYRPLMADREPAFANWGPVQPTDTAATYALMITVLTGGRGRIGPAFPAAVAPAEALAVARTVTAPRTP